MKASTLAILALVLAAGGARGYIVGPPIGLEDLANESDVIFRGTVESNKTVNDASFQQESGFVVQETVLSDVWVTKVAANVMPKGYRYSRPLGGDGKMRFRHYAGAGMMYDPQNYSLDVSKRYLIFAKQPDPNTANACRQIWMSQTGMADEGVLLCTADSHVGNGLIKDIVWDALTTLVKSKDPKEVVYGIEHLNAFSGSHVAMRNFGQLSEFQRSDVLATVHGLVNDANREVAQAALKVVGSDNPYLWQDLQGWLATVGGAEMAGFERSDSHFINEGGATYWRELAAVADGKADDATRALAVRALGLVREPSLEGSVKRWLGDKSTAVRASATLLLADYPVLATFDRFAKLANDSDPAVRASAAYAIGFMQKAENMPLLVKMNLDPTDKVRQAASQSLLSFSPKDPQVERIFRENLNNPESRPLFIVALGQQDPARNLDLLIDETAKKTDPENWPGGQIPAFTTSHLLFDYLNGLPATDIQSGKYDKALDALEIWTDPNHAVDPSAVYELEMNAGLKDRAQKFRAAIVKANPADAGYFKNADKTPQ